MTTTEPDQPDQLVEPVEPDQSRDAAGQPDGPIPQQFGWARRTAIRVVRWRPWPGFPVTLLWIVLWEIAAVIGFAEGMWGDVAGGSAGAQIIYVVGVIVAPPALYFGAFLLSCLEGRSPTDAEVSTGLSRCLVAMGVVIATLVFFAPQDPRCPGPGEEAIETAWFSVVVPWGGLAMLLVADRARRWNRRLAAQA